MSVCRLLSQVQLFATPWSVARQAPLSVEFSRQVYGRGEPFPSPGDLPRSRDGTRVSHIADSLPSEPPGKRQKRQGRPQFWHQSTDPHRIPKMPSRGQSQSQCQLPTPPASPDPWGPGPHTRSDTGISPARTRPCPSAAQPGFPPAFAAPLLAERGTSSQLTEEVRGK